MALDHYLPATYLASFSDEEVVPRRERRILCGDIQTKKCRWDKVGNIAAENDFYRVESKDLFPVDSVWGGYESQFATALEELISGSLEAEKWLRVLVPFVAGILVRGPDFNQRFTRRVQKLQFTPDKDNINSVRLIELQRLLAPVLVARWQVFEINGSENLIANDIGFAPYTDTNTGSLGITVPLNKQYTLALTPKLERPIIVAREDRWFPLIEYTKLKLNNQDDLNKTLAVGARRFIFGSNESTIQSLLHEKRRNTRVPEPGEIGFISGPHAAVHEFTWHKLVSAISKKPSSKDSWNFEFDWKQIANGWAPPVFLPVNLPQFPPALQRIDNVIGVNLYEVPGFT
jgi:hypothetical protein